MLKSKEDYNSQTMNNEYEEQKKWNLIPHYKILTIIIFATLLGWTAFFLVLQKLDPFNNTDLALSLFFASSFMALSGTFTILLFLLKRWRTGDNVYIKHMMVSMRQGILLSLCTNICLGLLAIGLLRIWNGLILVILMMLIEFYFSGKDDLK